MPISSSFVRSDRIASSSSRAMRSGHQSAPAARIPARSRGCALRARVPSSGPAGACDRCARRHGRTRVRHHSRRNRAVTARCHARRPVDRSLQRARVRVRVPSPGTRPVSRSHRRAASPWRAVRARLRSSCRRCRRDRAAPCACRSAASVRPCRAARRAAALRAATRRTSGRRRAGSRRTRARARNRRPRTRR